MNALRMSEQEYADYMARHNRPTISFADVERAIGDAAKATHARQAVGEVVRVKFHSKRKRLTDPDGLYSKAAIDGLREGGLLIDDSAAYVESVSYTQECAEVEETVITVEAFTA